MIRNWENIFEGLSIGLYLLIRAQNQDREEDWILASLHREKFSANLKHHVGLLCEQEISLFNVRLLTDRDLLLSSSYNPHHFNTEM